MNETSDKIYSVGEVSSLIKSLLDRDQRLRSIHVRGEISTCRLVTSGHFYFTLKDEGAALKAVMFNREWKKLRFTPEAGMKVIVLGRISLFPADGAYQLYADTITPDGVGDLHMAFQQLKERLRAQGYFNSDHKKPLPVYPKKIALITSAAGHAVWDIIKVASKRWPLVKFMVLPVHVEGPEAPAEIASAIRYANRHHLADLIITGRGGGPMEKLWTFNDERIARAIYNSEIPVISSVGHEPDFTIADFVADLRASTPTDAAVHAVPDRVKTLETIRVLEKRMITATLSRLEAENRRLRLLRERRVLQDPRVYLDERTLALDNLQQRLETAATALISRRKSALISPQRLETAVSGVIRRKRAAYEARTAALDAMSPLKVLARGYSITIRENGALVRSSREVDIGEELRLRLAEGSVACKVLRKEESDGQ